MSRGIFDDEENVKYGTKDYAAMTLYEIRKIAPGYEKRLRDGAFNAAKDKEGYYVCARRGLKDKSKIPFQVDHILPLNHKDGKTVPENLQILFRSCNAKKSDSL